MLPSFAQLALRPEVTTGAGARVTRIRDEKVHYFEQHYDKRDEERQTPSEDARERFRAREEGDRVDAELAKYFEDQVTALGGNEPAFVLETLQNLFAATAVHMPTWSGLLAALRNLGGCAKIVAFLNRDHEGDAQEEAASLLAYICDDAVTMWEVQWCYPTVVNLLVDALVQGTVDNDWPLVLHAARVLQMFVEHQGDFDMNGEYVAERGPGDPQFDWRAVTWKSRLTKENAYETATKALEAWKPLGTDALGIWSDYMPSLFFKHAIQAAGGVGALVNALRAFHLHTQKSEEWKATLSDSRMASRAVSRALKEMVTLYNLTYRNAVNGNELEKLEYFEGEISELVGQSFRDAGGASVLVSLAMDKVLMADMVTSRTFYTWSDSAHPHTHLDVLLQLLPTETILLPRASIAHDILDADYVRLATQWLYHEQQTPPQTGAANELVLKMLQLFLTLCKYTDKAKKMIAQQPVYGTLDQAGTWARDEVPTLTMLAMRLPHYTAPAPARALTEHYRELALEYIDNQDGYDSAPRDLKLVLQILTSIVTDYPDNQAAMRTVVIPVGVPGPGPIHKRLLDLLAKSGLQHNWTYGGSELLKALLQDDVTRDEVVLYDDDVLLVLLQKYARDTPNNPMRRGDRYDYLTFPILKRLCGVGKAYDLVAKNFTIPRVAYATNEVVANQVRVEQPYLSQWMGGEGDTRTSGLVRVDFKRLVNEVLLDEDVLASAAVHDKTPSLVAALQLLHQINNSLEMDESFSAPKFPVQSTKCKYVYTPEELEEVRRRRGWEALLVKLHRIYKHNVFWHETIDDACDKTAALLGKPVDGNVLCEYENHNWPDGDDLPPAVKKVRTRSAADIVEYAQLNKVWVPGYGAGIERAL